MKMTTLKGITFEFRKMYEQSIDPHLCGTASQDEQGPVGEPHVLRIDTVWNHPRRLRLLRREYDVLTKCSNSIFTSASLESLKSIQ